MKVRESPRIRLTEPLPRALAFDAVYLALGFTGHLAWWLCILIVFTFTIVGVQQQCKVNAIRAKARAKERAIPPSVQLKAIADAYGLPLVTAPPVSAYGFAHMCGGKTYPNWTYCPEHGNREAPKAPYVPAGYPELQRDLLTCVREQVDEAKRTRWTSGRIRYWTVSPEWLEDLRSLRTSGGSGAPMVVHDERGSLIMQGYKIVVGTGPGYGLPVLNPRSTGVNPMLYT